MSKVDANAKKQAKELARKFQLEFVDLKNFELDYELVRSIPVNLMIKHRFIPLEKDNQGLKIAIADPSDLPAIDELEATLGVPLILSVASADEIDDFLKKSQASQRVLEEASKGFLLKLVKEEEEGISLEKVEQDTSPMIRLVDTIILNAIERRASDIHIETKDREVIVRYRIDGALTQAMAPIDKRYHTNIISRIKVMSELDIAEKRVPQDGRFRLQYKGRMIDFRVSIMPNIYGEDAVIRILDKEYINREFGELRLDVLGFSPRELKKIRKYIHQPYGMFLVTGPTGSGKTTTLYAAISEIRNEEDKIITIEDPVEYQIPGITQVPINEKKGLTFARGLRSILRHDPDKIMVGEIRDPETAQIAVQSALTGHLVLTTVHANNVFDVIGRLLNMGVEPYNFVSALNCVSAQRLVRVICENCKTEVRYPPELLEESGLDPKKYRDFVFYEGKGCIECNGTGFRGRTAIMELLEMSDRIREMILDRASGSELKRAAKEEGMTFLREVALERVFSGITTLREINKVTFVE
ncbi:MAG: type II/IV secretion system protein [Acidobacteria bacterium]|nr:type II/IV secretion system protein [Acidobacteriota bacterium]